MLRSTFIIFLLLISFSVQAVGSFTQAKKKLYKRVFDNQGTTLYCGCLWQNKQVDLSSCGLHSYFPKKHLKRARRTEAEHIIPASWLLKVNKKYRQCAIDSKAHKDSKRYYCRKHDDDYKKAHNDLVNLMPAVGQINADRSNKPFVDYVTTEKNGYGKCTAVSGTRGFTPPDSIKGDIARVAFYMSKTYGVVYSKRQHELFIKWDVFDPVTVDEVKHHQRVMQVQGYGITVE